MDVLVCLKCGSTQNVVKHHTSYADDVTVPLCRSCHHKAHSNLPGYEDLRPAFDADYLTTISLHESTKAKLDAVKLIPRESYTALLDRLLGEPGR